MAFALRFRGPLCTFLTFWAYFNNNDDDDNKNIIRDVRIW